MSRDEDDTFGAGYRRREAEESVDKNAFENSRGMGKHVSSNDGIASSNEEYGVNFRVHFGGRFFMCGNVIEYQKGLVLLCRGVDRKSVSKEFLVNMIREDGELAHIRALYYLKSGKNIDQGLVRIVDDTVIANMMKYAGWDKFLHLYVLQRDEPGPEELRALGHPADVVDNPYPCPSSPSTRVSPLEIVAKPKLNKLTPRRLNRSSLTTSQQPLTKVSPQVFTGEFGSHLDEEDSEAEVVGLETSSDDSDSDFDEFFNDNVDLETFSSQEGNDIGDSGEEISRAAESDQLDSECGSEGDSKRKRKWVQFDAATGFKKKIEFKTGMLFSSNEVFRKALRQFSIEGGGDFYYLHNNKTKVYAYCMNKCRCKTMKAGRKQCSCKEVLCNWKVCARKVSADGTFQLKSIVSKHVCGWQEKNTKVTSIWLAEKYLEHYRDDPSWKLTAFMGAVLREHHLEISYSQAWRARLRAILMTQGDAALEYGKVWDYAATIQKTNSGSSAFVMVDLGNPEKPLFQRMYICLQACKLGFLKGCRDIIGLDGCHLKGAYTGQVLVAVGQDGNNNIFPIAYAVVEAERKDSWLWFLNNLLNDIGESDPTFISDRQKGLLEALNSLTGLSQNRVCVRHMYNNFKTNWPGKQFKDLVWAAARASIKAEFDCVMEQIKTMDQRAFEYLMSQETLSWSRHRFNTELKSVMLLNNLCESFNAWILPAREMSVLSMMEWIRRQLMNRFVSKRESMVGYPYKFTPNARKLIESAKAEGTRWCSVWFGGGSEYEVHHRGETYVVDLNRKTCGCRRWELTGIPCPHAMASIVKARVGVDDYVSKYYSVELYLKAYGETLHPVPGKSQYVQSGMIMPMPPKYVIQPGRPKKNGRRREEGEDIPSKIPTKRRRIVGVRKCSNCGHQGHNKQRCQNPTRGPERKNNKAAGRPTHPSIVPLEGVRKRRPRKMPIIPSQEGSHQPSVEENHPITMSQPIAKSNDLDAIQNRRYPRTKAFFQNNGSASAPAIDASVRTKEGRMPEVNQDGEQSIAPHNR